MLAVNYVGFWFYPDGKNCQKNGFFNLQNNGFHKTCKVGQGELNPKFDYSSAIGKVK